jgi:hypothetical protein
MLCDYLALLLRHQRAIMRSLIASASFVVKEHNLIETSKTFAFAISPSGRSFVFLMERTIVVNEMLDKNEKRKM